MKLFAESINEKINTANLAVVSVSSNGTYEMTFTAVSTNSHIAVQNAVASTRDFYVDDFVVEEITTTGFLADIRQATDYSPFGVTLEDRNLTLAGAEKSRYGFNGMEKDNEMKFGDGNSYTTEFRQLDPRLGRWLSIDPKATPWESPYVSMGNNPITFNDLLGDTIKFAPGITEEQIKEFEAKLATLNESELFRYYYGALVSSTTVYTIELNEEMKKGGQFNPNNNTITFKSTSLEAVIAQEIFHAFQRDLGVYDGTIDHAIIEAEGDIMTQYVANETSISLFAFLAEQEDTWAADLLRINGDSYTNPTNEQVQSEEYDKLFTDAVSKRIEFFKEKNNDAYKGYTAPNSGNKPIATKKVFEAVFND